MSDSTVEYGNLNDNSLEEIWNNDKYKQLRKNMINDDETKECSRCYEMEKSNIWTLRKNVNKYYIDHWDRVESTKEDGTVEELNMGYMDIRVSNICNFKCRSCSPELSSGWYEDHIKLYSQPLNPRIMNIANNEKFWNDLQPLLLTVEEACWAGGEPIITEEHYKILDFWIENKMKDVRLRYTTNFSNLYFKKKSILEYWNSFNDVRIAASLDGMGKRGELIRAGTNWDAIEENRKQMIKECPDVYFEITPTVSIMNVYHLPDFHKDWVERGLLEPNNVRMNILTYPDDYRIQIIPPKERKKFIDKYYEHIKWIDDNFGDGVAKSGFESILDFLQQENYDNLIPEFISRNKGLDELREESLFKVCPELEFFNG
tara:strand:- start:192 stop:1310 length:1119 start_codon:yes stop_codon:yes gene_type:complete